MLSSTCSICALSKPVSVVKRITGSGRDAFFTTWDRNVSSVFNPQKMLKLKQRAVKSNTMGRSSRKNRQEQARVSAVMGWRVYLEKKIRIKFFPWAIWNMVHRWVCIHHLILDRRCPQHIFFYVHGNSTISFLLKITSEIQYSSSFPIRKLVIRYHQQPVLVTQHHPRKPFRTNHRTGCYGLDLHINFSSYWNLLTSFNCLP